MIKVGVGEFVYFFNFFYLQGAEKNHRGAEERPTFVEKEKNLKQLETLNSSL